MNQPAEYSWEEHAQWWIDGFTGGVDPEYVEQIIPMALRELDGYARVLDVGCGEGQIARVLQSRTNMHSHVVGVDPTQGQVDVAVERAVGEQYLRSGADALPFASGTFDAVLACLVFEHIDALDEAIGEVARVLRPGGRFSFFLNHPLLQTPNSGWIDDQMIDPPEQYWRVGSYLDEAITFEEVEPGVRVRFLHRPLSRYVNALAAHGLYLEAMFEPAPPAGFLARSADYVFAASIPRLLCLRLCKFDTPSSLV
ncbi:MAG: methyltransferase domain-containing protein [Actinomycetes bacterium]